MNNPTFIHLRVHTEYSLIDGMVRIKPLVKAAAAMKMPAVAMTDHVNLFGAVKFYKAALAAGIKPILGVDLLLANPSSNTKPWRLTLLCQDQPGYKNLTRLISKAYLEGQQSGLPIIQPAWLEDGASMGLIALSGGQQGDIGQALLAGQLAEATQYAQKWLALFPNRFYLELQRIDQENEEDYIDAALSLAEQLTIPVVATNDVRFLHSTDFEAHEARVCIQGGYILSDPKRPRAYTEQQYLRTPEEMAVLFADIPEALANTVEIAKRCNLSLELGKSWLPNFPTPAHLSIEQYLTDQAQKGLAERLQKIPAADNSVYQQRLALELSVINSMGFAGYFLIVADFILWAKNNGIPVGPGRGSGAGSLAAYALHITDLDPLQYDLLFERFLNPERVSMPDFDIDFCMDGRDRVIHYVADKYGRNSVSQIITYGSMAAKAVVRDVGRVLAQPYGFVDKIAKLIPFELGMTLGKALEQEEELQKRYQEEEDVHTLIDLARKLEGLARNAGTHAGGVVIAPSVLTDFSPLYCEPGGENVVTQFDKDDVEAIGLVKFDFLGLRTLTVINWAVQIINQKRLKLNEPLLDMSLLTPDDSATYQMIKTCATTAVFQLESRGMKDLIKRIQPDCFEEIIALVALFRPGPLQSGMVDDFINRKHGRAKVAYPHPALESILSPTYGVILYQEQVMQIAQVLAGYTLGGADILRRAMGKKKVEEMAKQRSIFIEGAKQGDVPEDVSNHIFDLMEKFSGYGFNKSHSAAYALLSYQTAWLKTHYPAEYMSAVLSSDMDNTDKIVSLIAECRSMNLKILPPDINRSEYQFTVTDNGEINYGLGAIKGVGEAAITSIIADRKSNSSFNHLFEFCQRMDARKVNRRTLEALIQSGAMDALGSHRASLMKSLDKAVLIAEQHTKTAGQRQTQLFESEHLPTLTTQLNVDNDVERWSTTEYLLAEKNTLGLYFSGHPLQQYEKELSHLTTGKIANLASSYEQTVTIAGIVVATRNLFTKKGDRMAFVTLEDQTGRIDLAVFSDTYATCKDFLIKDNILIVEGDISVDEYSGGHKLGARRIMNITQARETYAKRLLIKIKNSLMDDHLTQQLVTLMQPHSAGTCPVGIEYQRTDATLELALGPKWRVSPGDELLVSLRKLLGDDSVVVDY